MEPRRIAFKYNLSTFLIITVVLIGILFTQKGFIDLSATSNVCLIDIIEPFNVSDKTLI